MSTKTTFKRIALVAVAALGLGVLSVAPSSAAITDETMTVGTPSATSVSVGDSVTVSVDLSFLSDTSSDTRSVNIVGNGDGFANHIIRAVLADSSNVTNHGGTPSTNAGYEQTQVDGTVNLQDTITVTTGALTSRAKFTIVLYNANVVGTYSYTITSRQGTNGAIGKSSSFSVTVTAQDTTATAAKSKLWFNKVATPARTVFNNFADSTLVISAGTLPTYNTAGFIYPEFRNAADTTLTTSGSLVSGTITLVVNGPGLLTNTPAGGTEGAKAKTVTVTLGETVTVYADGTAGVGTITGSIGGVNLTQAAKTVTFYGKPSTITATLESKTVTGSGTATGIISLIIKDSAGNALDSNAVYNTGTPGGFYAIVSDTKVVGGTALKTGTTPAYSSAATYDSANSKWTLALAINDSGTTTVQISDSYTVASSVATVSAALTVKAVGAVWTGTLAFDKATYAPGEKAIITLTAKDYAGLDVMNGAHSPFAAPTSNGQYWGTLVPTFGSSGAFTTVEGLLAATTFVDGVDTAVVYMPTVAGTYTWSATTQGANKTAVTASFSVVDPAATAAAATAAANAAATAAAIAAAKDASDAATDAALEATDAAYAATDAANIAAEAADAATAAAEAATEAANAAKESADAATAAVEELATSVAKLMAALQAQITTLAKVVAKIAVKVKA